MALMTDFADGDPDPVDRVVVEADLPPDVVAHDLHEIEHLERAGELEADDLVTVDRHGCGLRKDRRASEYHMLSDVKPPSRARGGQRAVRQAGRSAGAASGLPAEAPARPAKRRDGG